MKQPLLVLANAIGLIWRLIPAFTYHFTDRLFVWIALSSSGGWTASAAYSQDKLEWVINERAMAYGGSEHPNTG